MLGQHFTTILAQTDPFDLAQGIDRYVRSLSGEQVRFVIAAAQALMSEGYRAEFVPLLEEHDDERLKSAFIQALKSNLRAVPLFGAAFCEGVIGQVPGDRAVALGEEGYNFRQVRPLALGIIALALLIAGAAGEHVWSTARATAETPVVLVTPPALDEQTPAPAPPPAAAAPAPTPQHTAAAPVRRAPTPQPATPQPTPQPATPQPPPPTPVSTAQTLATRAPQIRPTPQRTPPPGRGVLTVIAVQRTPAPTPEPTEMDLSDMPQSFSDATPLPRAETAPSAQAPTRVDVSTPTPGPNRFFVRQTINGTLRTLNNLNPFRRKAPAPTPSPSGPQP